MSDQINSALKVSNDVSFKCFTGCSIQIDAGVSTFPISEMQTGSLSPVDKESYRPSDVTTRSQLLSPGGVPMTGAYDFPDGKDTGIRPVRRLDLDRVQVDELIKQKLADAEKIAQDAEADSLAKARAKTEAENAKQARINEAVETSKAVAKASKDV